MPLNRSVLEDMRPLRIGWFDTEYTYPAPCAAAMRAVEMTKAALEAAGHTLVPFRPETEGVLTRADLDGCDHAMHVLDNSVGRSGGGTPKNAEEKEPDVGSYGGGPLKGERIHPDLKAAYAPKPKNTKSAIGTDHPETNTPGKYQDALGWRDKLRDRFARYWASLDLDVLLCPACPVPASQVEETRNWHIGGVSWCRVYNVLDYPAGIVTVTKVSAADLAEPYDPDTDDPYMSQCAKAAVADSLGLPMSVQVVAPPWREELCLRAMLEVQRLLPFDHTQHARLAPIPRRSPDLGAKPELVLATSPSSKL